MLYIDCETSTTSSSLLNSALNALTHSVDSKRLVLLVEYVSISCDERSRKYIANRMHDRNVDEDGKEREERDTSFSRYKYGSKGIYRLPPNICVRNTLTVGAAPSSGYL
jgi:hypothetical protein